MLRQLHGVQLLMIITTFVLVLLSNAPASRLDFHSVFALPPLHHELRRFHLTGKQNDYPIDSKHPMAPEIIHRSKLWYKKEPC
jgi:hypothetical protein